VVPAFVFEEPGFGFAFVFLTTRVCFGAETGFFDFVLFADFLADFFGDFFAAGFLAAFFAVFLVVFLVVFLAVFFAAFFAVFLAFFAAGPLFVRFFEAAALAARGDTFFAFFFFEGFFLKATTNSFMAQTNCLD
jgi:ABC-type phosphate transport system permease subunit